MFEISRFLERNPDCSAFFHLTRRCCHRRCRKKFDVWESEYIQGPQERLMGLFPICYNLFCSQLNHITLHMDVKERAAYLSRAALKKQRFTWVENGGPDRTRTYDPRLIKAVL